MHAPAEAPQPARAMADGTDGVLSVRASGTCAEAATQGTTQHRRGFGDSGGGSLRAQRPVLPRPRRRRQRSGGGLRGGDITRGGRAGGVWCRCRIPSCSGRSRCSPACVCRQGRRGSRRRCVCLSVSLSLRVCLRSCHGTRDLRCRSSECGHTSRVARGGIAWRSITYVSLPFSFSFTRKGGTMPQSASMHVCIHASKHARIEICKRKSMQTLHHVPVSNNTPRASTIIDNCVTSCVGVFLRGAGGHAHALVCVMRFGVSLESSVEQMPSCSGC